MQIIRLTTIILWSCGVQDPTGYHVPAGPHVNRYFRKNAIQELSIAGAFVQMIPPEIYQGDKKLQTRMHNPIDL